VSDADLYFDGEVAVLASVRSQAKAEALAAERKKQRERDEQYKEIRRRQAHMVAVDEDEEEICLLDVDAEKLQAALDEIGHGGASLMIDEETLRAARAEYLAGRSARAADVIYPAIRDALGVAV
jgi:hypothetical protein